MEGQKFTRREAIAGIAAGIAGIGALANGIEKKGGKGPETPKSVIEKESEYVPVSRNEFFDGNPDYLRSVTNKNGEFSKKQRKQRRRTFANGETIFDDVGLKFYLVKRGDTISEIRQNLSQYDEFVYLKEQTGKLTSFNIPEKKLRADMWIPISVEEKDRKLTEAQFVSYADAGIDRMKEHPVYGKEIERILKKVSERELILTMIAVAKQEGGGRPLGQFTLHRWEHHKKAFSFSYFHVLMKGPGLTARRKLNLTEGQLLHPENAVMLFLAFLIEKTKERAKHADRYFPIWEHDEDFAKFYNGGKWKEKNPDYLVNLERYYQEADAHLDEDGVNWFVKAKK